VDLVKIANPYEEDIQGLQLVNSIILFLSIRYYQIF